MLRILEIKTYYQQQQHQKYFVYRDLIMFTSKVLFWYSSFLASFNCVQEGNDVVRHLAYDYVCSSSKREKMTRENTKNLTFTILTNMLLQCVRTSFKWGTSSENPNLAKLEFSTFVKQKIRQIEERLAMQCLDTFTIFLPFVRL